MCLMRCRYSRPGTGGGQEVGARKSGFHGIRVARRGTCALCPINWLRCALPQVAWQGGGRRPSLMLQPEGNP